MIGGGRAAGTVPGGSNGPFRSALHAMAFVILLGAVVSSPPQRPLPDLLRRRLHIIVCRQRLLLELLGEFVSELLGGEQEPAHLGALLVNALHLLAPGVLAGLELLAEEL